MARFALARRIDRPVGEALSFCCGLLLALLVMFAGVQTAGAESEKADLREHEIEDSGDESNAVGHLIRVPLPISGNVDNVVQGMVQRALSRVDRDGSRPILVLEFVPTDNDFGQGTQFSRALDLAQFLSSPEMARVKTVALIPESIKGHAVLVAMACEDIVMSPDAEIGDAGVDEPAEVAIEPAMLSAYNQIAERRKTIPAPIALGMLDRRLEVLKVETDTSFEYLLRKDLAELEERAAVGNVEVLVRPGELGRFTGRQGRELGFVKYLASTRDEAANALGLEPSQLRDDPSLGGDWDPVQFELDGLVTAQAVDRLQSMLDDTLRAAK